MTVLSSRIPLKAKNMHLSASENTHKRRYCYALGCEDLSAQQVMLYAHIVSNQVQDTYRGALSEFGGHIQIGRQLRQLGDKGYIRYTSDRYGIHIRYIKPIAKDRLVYFEQSLLDLVLPQCNTVTMAYKICAYSVEYYRRFYRYGRCFLGSLADSLGCSERTLERLSALFVDPWHGKPPVKLTRRSVDKRQKVTDKTTPINPELNSLDNIADQQADPLNALRAVDRMEKPKKPKTAPPGKQSQTGQYVELGILKKRKEHEYRPLSDWQKQSIADYRKYAMCVVSEDDAARAVAVLTKFIIDYDPVCRCEEFRRRVIYQAKKRGVCEFGSGSVSDVIRIGKRALLDGSYEFWLESAPVECTDDRHDANLNFEDIVVEGELDRDNARRFIQERYDITHKPMTGRQMQLTIDLLSRLSVVDQKLCVDRSIQAGWPALYALTEKPEVISSGKKYASSKDAFDDKSLLDF